MIAKKMLPYLLALLSVFMAVPSRSALADVPTISHGPTVAFMRFGFAKDPSNPTNNTPTFNMITAGAGYGVELNPRAFLSPDKKIEWLSIDVTAFAQLSSLPKGGALSLAVGVSTYNGLLGIQVGGDLFNIVDGQDTEGLFTLSGGVRNIYFLIPIHFNFGSAPPPPPPGAMAAPPEHLPNYIYF